MFNLKKSICQQQKLESSSPPPPLIVSEETNEIYDSDMSSNDDLITYPNIPTMPKWAENTI